MNTGELHLVIWPFIKINFLCLFSSASPTVPVEYQRRRRLDPDSNFRFCAIVKVMDKDAGGDRRGRLNLTACPVC